MKQQIYLDYAAATPRQNSTLARNCQAQAKLLLGNYLLMVGSSSPRKIHFVYFAGAPERGIK